MRRSPKQSALATRLRAATPSNFRVHETNPSGAFTNWHTTPHSVLSKHIFDTTSLRPPIVRLDTTVSINSLHIYRWSPNMVSPTGRQCHPFPGHLLLSDKQQRYASQCPLSYSTSHVVTYPRYTPNHTTTKPLLRCRPIDQNSVATTSDMAIRHRHSRY